MIYCRLWKNYLFSINDCLKCRFLAEYTTKENIKIDNLRQTIVDNNGKKLCLIERRKDEFKAN